MNETAIYQKALRIADFRLSIMRGLLEAKLSASRDEWQGLEPSDYASLILELKKNRIKTDGECQALYDKLFDTVQKYGAKKTYEALKKQVGDGTNDSRMDTVFDDGELDSVVDRLSSPDRPWNNLRRLPANADNAYEFERFYNIGMWWDISGAIKDLLSLKKYGRLENTAN